MKEMTPEQYEAVHFFDKPLIITASAGSGKTCVIVNRYLEILRKGISIPSIVMITFTRKAAEEMRARIRNELEAQESPILSDFVFQARIGTIHSFCEFLLQDFKRENLFPSLSKVIDDLDFSILKKKSFEKWLCSIEQKKIEILLSSYSIKELKEMAEELCNNRFYIPFDYLQKKRDKHRSKKSIIENFSCYLNDIFENTIQVGTYSFDDLEGVVLFCLKNSSQLRKKYQEKFQFILIDEVQDLSPIQWEILQVLIGNQWDKIFLVGDPKQSIYGFRKASGNLFEKIQNTILSNQGKRISLNRNFRTDAILLQEINKISEGIFSEQYVSMLSKEELISQQTSNSSINTVHSSLEERLLIHFYNGVGNKETQRKSELESVFELIKVLISDGVSAGEIAILFRSSEEILNYKRKLESQKIAVKSDCFGEIFSKYFLIHLFNYLKTISNPMDDLYLASFLVSPWIEMPKKELIHSLFESQKNNVSLYEMLREKTKWRSHWVFEVLNTRLPFFFEAIDTLLKNTSWTRNKNWDAEIIYFFLERFPLKTTSIFEVLEVLKIWDMSKARIAFSGSEQKILGVNLLTVHGAKGLEFEHVFLVDLLRGCPNSSPLFFINNSASNKEVIFREEKGIKQETSEFELAKKRKWEEEQKENQRILYVALTRAKKWIHVFLPNLEGENIYGKNSFSGSWASWFFSHYCSKKKSRV